MHKYRRSWILLEKYLVNKKLQRKQNKEKNQESFQQFLDKRNLHRKNGPYITKIGPRKTLFHLSLTKN